MIQEQQSDDYDDDQNIDFNNANDAGGIDQEQLTNEEKEEQIIKTLNSNNPQAPHNVCQFSFKERLFKVDDQVDHLVFHVNLDGSILLKDSDDARD